MKKFDKEYHRKWRKENKEKVKEIINRYNKKHPKKVKLHQKNWRQKKSNYNKKWFEKNINYKDYHKKWGYKLKLEVFIHYSYNPPRCVICGFNDIRALALDHINNDGAKQRRSLKTGKKISGRGIYALLKKQGYPEGFQILCANCNMIKELNRREIEYEKKHNS